jgi:hypothetical protein
MVQALILVTQLAMLKGEVRVESGKLVSLAWLKG